jgi:biopolymer transport protein ExbD
MKIVRRNTPSEGITDPNLTALIDVSLVLVVILLVATPMALQSGIGVSNAATTGRDGAAADAARIEVSIVDDQTVVVNGITVARAELAATLRPRIADSGTRDVVVRCGDAVAHGVFVSVIDEAKALGAARIAVAGHSSLATAAVQ